MAKYDEAPVPRGTSRRWEVLLSEDDTAPQANRRRRLALEVRAEHRVLQGFSETELEKMPLVAEGTRLARRGWYLDLHDPARGDFVAEGDEVVDPGQHVVSRNDVDGVLWEELRRACDAVLGRHTPDRLRPAV
jgi:hypothetical protein